MSDAPTAPRSRRDRGAGRVYFDETKRRWVGAITVDGRVVKRLVKTEAQAKAKVRELLAGHQAGKLATTCMTLREWIAEWLADSILPNRAAGRPNPLGLVFPPAAGTHFQASNWNKNV
jgi:hypothetical protein